MIFALPDDSLMMGCAKVYTPDSNAVNTLTKTSKMVEVCSAVFRALEGSPDDGVGVIFSGRKPAVAYAYR